MQKKSLINNLKTTKKAIVASKPTEAKSSVKVTPRTSIRVRANVSPVRTRVTSIKTRVAKPW
jgi:hypothetical protein